MKTILCILLTMISVVVVAAQTDKQFSTSLMQDSCEFSTTGRNAYFVLEPGYQLTLEDKKGGQTGHYRSQRN